MLQDSCGHHNSCLSIKKEEQLMNGKPPRKPEYPYPRLPIWW
nr:MAG TPA: hypothetical protein [Caudoviricetes sp.]